MKEEIILKLNDFHSKLENLVLEELCDGQISSEEINEFYGFVNDCQTTKIFKEQNEIIGKIEKIEDEKQCKKS